MVFPIGKFRFLWSFEISDLYGGVVKHQELIGDDESIAVDSMKKWYTENPKDLCKALNSGGELMIGASHYRAVSFRVAKGLRAYPKYKGKENTFGNEYGDEVYQFENAWDMKAYDKFIEGEFF
jgi:hypothetical protein